MKSTTIWKLIGAIAALLMGTLGYVAATNRDVTDVKAEQTRTAVEIEHVRENIVDMKYDIEKIDTRQDQIHEILIRLDKRINSSGGLDNPDP